jgi:hypothetical protein
VGGKEESDKEDIFSVLVWKTSNDLIFLKKKEDWV